MPWISSPNTERNFDQLDVTASKSHAFGPAFRKQVKTFKPLCLKKLGDSRLSGPIS